MAIGNSTILANATIQLNGEALSYVPNSLKEMAGLGSTISKAATAGGNTINIVTSVDVSTKIAKVTFEVYFTPDTRAIITQAKLNGSENVLSIFANNPLIDVQYDYNSVSINNEPEWNYSADGTTMIECAGLPSL